MAENFVESCETRVITRVIGGTDGVTFANDLPCLAFYLLPFTFYLSVSTVSFISNQ